MGMGAYQSPVLIYTLQSKSQVIRQYFLKISQHPVFGFAILGEKLLLYHANPIADSSSIVFIGEERE